jgi:hypothetical protein
MNHVESRETSLSRSGFSRDSSHSRLKPLLQRAYFHHQIACAALLALACAAPVLADSLPTACLDMAAQNYGIRKEILSAVLSVEGGRPGLRKYNTNGSYDMGPMQVNSIWLPELRRRGISEYEVTHDYCTNILVGAWILARELKRSGAQMNTPEFWKAVGNYNSRTPYFNVRYAVRVWREAKNAQLSFAENDVSSASGEDSHSR